MSNKIETFLASKPKDFAAKGGYFGGELLACGDVELWKTSPIGSDGVCAIKISVAQAKDLLDWLKYLFEEGS